MATLLFCAWHVSYAQMDLQQPLGGDSSVLEGKLANGLTYYVRSNAKPAKKVELRLVVKAGSVLENDNQQGLAHFMEHMEFNGLKHYPKNDLVDYLQKIGVRFGADLNANTSWDRTYFMLPIPTDNPENVEKGFQIVSDWADGALITTEEVNAERHVILEELRVRNKNAQSRMMQRYLPDLFNHSRYAYRTPSGLDSIVQYADPDRIREFYHDWYRPDLMAVIVVGDISKPKALSLIEKYFSNLKKPLKERERTYYHVEPYKEKKALVVSDSESTKFSFSLVYPSHTTKANETRGDFNKELAKNIFAQCLNHRFSVMAQAPNASFTSAKLSLTGSIGGITLWDENMELDITPITDLRLSESINAGIGELLNAGKNGFTESEIEMAKKAYLSVLDNVFEGRNDVPSGAYADTYATAFMKGVPLIGAEEKYQCIKELLPTISVSAINDYSKQQLAVPQSYFTLVVGGKIQKLPTDDTLLQMVSSAFQQQIKYKQASNSTIAKGEDSAVSLLDEQPIAGKILSETKDDQLGTTNFTLSNGLMVTVKQTDFQQDQVLFSGIKYGGSNMYAVKDKSNISFLGSIVGAVGFGRFNAIQLSDYLMGKRVSVNVGMNGITDEISGNSSIKDIQTMLELTYLKLTEPRSGAAMLTSWRNKLESQLPLFKTDPQTLFKDTLSKFIYHNDSKVPIVIPTPQDLDNIDVDRIMDIYKEQFGYADGFHFFFVGNVDADSLKPLIEKYIAALPVKGTALTYKDNGLRMITGDTTLLFYKGTDKKSLLLDMYHGNIQYSAGLSLKANMLAQVMTIELLKKVREEKQWIYSGTVSASLTKLPYGYYSITAQMPCGPESVDSIFAELDKEVAGYKQYGISEEDLEKVKKAMIEQYESATKDNKTWINELQQIYFWKSNKNNFLTFKQRVNSVTAEELQQTAWQLLNNNHFKSATFPENQ